MKKLAVFFCLLSICYSALADVQLGDIVRSTDGTTVRPMNSYDAENYCKNQGTRLPTARELALYAQSLGAQGVSDTPKKLYYQVIDGFDNSGRPNHSFYYNPSGYQPQTGDLPHHTIWSLPIYGNGYVFACVMTGMDAELTCSNTGPEDLLAVRCLK